MAVSTNFRFFRTDSSGSIIASGGGAGGAGGGFSLPSNLAYTNVSNVFQVDQSFLGDVNALTFTGNGASITNLNATALATGTVADARLSSNVALKDTNNSFSANQTFTQNVTVTGNLTVNGTQFIANTQTVLIEDNLLVINNGEVGAGVTLGVAGIEIDRGSLTNYQFLFEESSDLFKVGEVGSLQAVATRPDSVTNGHYARWNASTNALEFVDESSIISGDTDSFQGLGLTRFPLIDSATYTYSTNDLLAYTGSGNVYKSVDPSTLSVNNAANLGGVPAASYVTALSLADVATSGDYADLINVPQLVVTVGANNENVLASGNQALEFIAGTDIGLSYSLASNAITITNTFTETPQDISFALGSLTITDGSTVDLQTYFDGRYVQSVNVYDGWNLSATTGGSTLIGENETVTFIDGLNTTATRVGNTIQIDAALPSDVAYTNVANVFTQTQSIRAVNPALNFITTSTTTATMMSVIGASFVGTAPYNANRFVATNSSHLAFEAGGAEIMRVDSSGSVDITGDFSFSGTATGNGSGLTSVNAATLGGEAITKFMLYANPSDINWTNGKVASYQNGEFVPVALPSAAFTSFNLSATVGGSTTITDGETITFIDGLNTTATRVGNTIQIDTALASNVAYTDVNNNFSVGQTIGGNTTINGNLAVDTDTLFVDASTNRVGIGTDNPSAKLHIEDNQVTYEALRLHNKRASTGQIDLTFYNGTSDYSARITQFYVSGGKGEFGFYTGEGSTLGVYQDQNGNVGIGTSSPNGKFEIVQTASTRAFQVVRNENQANTEALAYFTDENTSNTQPTVRIRQDGTGDALQVLDGANMALVVRGDSGNVGIGTSSPQNKLHVEQNTDGDLLIEVDNQNTGTSCSAGLLLKGQGNNFFIRNYGDGTTNTNITEFKSTAGGSSFVFATANTERMRIDSSGNVGIGTDIALAKTHIKSGVSGFSGSLNVNYDDLAIEGGGNTGITILTPNANNGGIAFSDEDAEVRGLILYSHANDAMAFRTAGTERMRIDSSGNTTIKGNLTVDRTGASNYLTVSGDNNASYDIATQYTDGTNSVFAGMMRATSGLTGAWNVFTGGAVRMSVDSSGNVGIGKSPAGGVKLDVNGKIVSGDIDCARINTDDPGLGAGLWKLGKARVASTIAGNTVVRVEIDGVDYDLITTTVIPT